MNNTKTNLNKFNKSKKLKPKNPYEKYKNTKQIPITSILSYIFSGYQDFSLYKKKCEHEKRYTITLDDCFIIDKDSMPFALRKNKINLSLKMNPKTPLDRLLAYCFYNTQSSIFENDINSGIISIKYQLGKDIKRSDRTINYKPYPSSYYDKENNYEDADLFYQNIIDHTKLYYKKTNLNIVNKIALLSCQNMFNFITNLITLKLIEILNPETNSIFRPDKTTNITINLNEISLELYIKSKLIISRDGEPIDPEYPCGNLELRLHFDLLKNKYELKTFILDYDIDKCGPEISNQTTSNENKIDDKKSSKMKYILPTGAITAGLVTIPFILPLLGGKTKKNKLKKNKKKKTIKRKI
jgi:hypothetical protein